MKLQMNSSNSRGIRDFKPIIFWWEVKILFFIEKHMVHVPVSSHGSSLESFLKRMAVDSIQSQPELLLL